MNFIFLIIKIDNLKLSFVLVNTENINLKEYYGLKNFFKPSVFNFLVIVKTVELQMYHSMIHNLCTMKHQEKKEKEINVAICILFHELIIKNSFCLLSFDSIAKGNKQKEV